MTYLVLLHPDVIKYLDSLQSKENERCYNSLRCLEEDPFTSRPNCDIKKIKGKRKAIYRLRVGNHRFRYIIQGKEVLVREGFPRGRGY